jgi:tetrahydromethanopterin S-methyltransferase subunit E
MTFHSFIIAISGNVCKYFFVNAISGAETDSVIKQYALSEIFSATTIAKLSANIKDFRKTVIYMHDARLEKYSMSKYHKTL